MAKKGISSSISSSGKPKTSSSSSKNKTGSKPTTTSRPAATSSGSTIRSTGSSSSRADLSKTPSKPASSSRPASKPAYSSTTQKPSPTHTVSKGVGAAGAAATSAEHESRMATLRSRWERAAGLATLAALYDGLENMTGRISGMGNRMADLRARGYWFGRGWEDEVSALQGQWDAQRGQAVGILERERSVLHASSLEVDRLLDRAQSNAALFDTANNRLFDLERRTGEAERRVRGAYDQVQATMAVLEREMAGAEAVMEALETASFQLFPDEHGFAVCQAEWHARGTEPLEGLLFLTDSRLIFEQRQKVVTKKFLFIATEKETIQELQWQAPVGGIEILEVEDKKAFMSTQEFLALRLEGGEGPPEVELRLKNAANEAWAKLLRQAKEGRFDVERFDANPLEEMQEQAVKADAAAEAGDQMESKNLPTRCPNCNGQLPTIYKGMTEITCEYCGSVVRFG